MNGSLDIQTGAAALATQVEAQAGTNNTKMMTPLRAAEGFHYRGVRKDTVAGYPLAELSVFNENHGALVSIPVRLAEAAEVLIQGTQHVVPRPPFYFVLRQVWLLFDNQCTHEDGFFEGRLLSYSSASGLQDVVGISSSAVTDRVGVRLPSNSQTLLSPFDPLYFKVDEISPPYTETWEGGVLWLLGYYYYPFSA